MTNSNRSAPSLHRCDEQVCRIRTFEPLAWARALMPKKRPLKKLSFCEGGTFKVRNVEGRREMIVVENPNQADSCNVENAMDLM